MFRNVGIQQPDAGEIPKRIHIKFICIIFFLCSVLFVLLFLCMHDDFWLFVLILQLTFVLFSQHRNKRGTELRSIMK